MKVMVCLPSKCFNILYNSPGLSNMVSQHQFPGPSREIRKIEEEKHYKPRVNTKIIQQIVLGQMNYYLEISKVVSSDQSL